MASGDTLLEWHPFLAEPSSMPNRATLDYRNYRPCLDFDDTTAEYAVFSGVMPQHYDGGGVELYFHIAMSTATSGDIDWDAAFERVGEVLDLDNDSFAAANSTDNTTVPATCGQAKIVIISFSDGLDMDSVQAGEGFRMRTNRDAGNDTASGDAELYWVEMREA